MDNNQSYYIRRAREERFAAAQATSERAQQAHLEMAARYEGRIIAVVPQPEQPSAPPPDFLAAPASRTTVGQH